MMQDKDSERKQERHYAFLKELQLMTTELPVNIQQKVSHDLLSDLANALLDGTVFEIIRGLQEIQTMTEKDLFHTRCRKQNKRRAQRDALVTKHKEILHTLPPNSTKMILLKKSHHDELKKLDSQHAEEMKQRDMRTILEIDQLVSQQQVTLEKAGVPGFLVSNRPTEVRLQMHLLEMIARLDRKYNNYSAVE